MGINAKILQAYWRRTCDFKMKNKRVLLSNVVKFIMSFFFSFLDSLCILCLKEIIWAMATFLPFFWPWINYLGHGNFSWAMAGKVAMGENMLPMGKMVKC